VKFALILSGCGVFDGSEIHEATMTMLAVVRNGGEYEIFAPDVKQHHVINHLTGETMNESRNVLVESARIARGRISPLSSFKAGDFDAVIFPGGFGVAKNLCTYAFEGTDCNVDSVVEKVIRDTHGAGKPIGALCIAPVLITRILGGVNVTTGSDRSTSEAIEQMGGIHTITSHGEVVIDRKNRIVTTPCYMLDGSIDDIATGADNAVKALIEMIPGK
jgi:enhancing lycopene biosynthesis protein 2